MLYGFRRSVSTERPRFTTYDASTDHQPGLWIVTILSLTYAFLALLVRPIIRKKFLWTDLVLLAGYALGIVSYALMFVALHHGAGKAPSIVSESSYAYASKFVYASIIFLLLAGGCSSSSQLLQLKELVPSTLDKRVCTLSAIVCACSAIISAVTVSAGCSTSTTLDVGSGSCTGAVTRWSVATVFIIVNTSLPACVPFYVFKRLHAKRNRKLGIYLAFSFPLASIPVAAVALDLYVRFHHHGRSGIGIVGFLCCLEVLLGWSLICPTIPIGRPMALRFTTHGTLILSASSGSVTGSPDATATIGTAGLPLSKRRTSYRHDDEFNPDRFMHSHSASITHGESRDPMQYGQSDQGIRKTVETEIESMKVIDFVARHHV